MIMQLQPMTSSSPMERGRAWEIYFTLMLGRLALCILGSWEYLQVKMAGGMHCAWLLAQVEGPPSLLC